MDAGYSWGIRFDSGGSDGGERPDWDLIYSHLITVTGWTWDYIDDEMTLPRLEALNKYWSDFPPVHLTMAAYVGIKPKKGGKKAQNKEDFDRMVAAFGGCGLGKQVKHGR